VSLSLLLLAACAPSPVEWSANHSVTTTAAAPALTAGGAIVDDSLAPLARRLTPPVPACAGSLSIARAAGTIFAVWWAPRADSSARLLSAHTADDGKTWSAISPVDTTDRSTAGCKREPPGIAADGASGYLHVTYGMIAPEGPGLFFAHSMDRGVTFHSPVPILYGERLGRTSVSADGDIVAVTFDDPNSIAPRVGLALSRTMGHIFEDRLLPVSDDNGSASRPLVAVRGRHISVAWQERTAPNGGVVLRVRTGVLH
jgi:hypothetical protein